MQETLKTSSKKDFTNLHYGEDVTDMAVSHINYVIFNLFKERLSRGNIKCKNVEKNLNQLCILYGLSLLRKDCQGCFESGYFNAGSPYSEWIIQAMKTTNLIIRPQIVNIIESFGISDMRLQSAIGNSYGDIYETHLRWAEESRLNTTKAGDAIPDGYLEYITPILKAKL
jgi:hypothetical protein